ncbi:putative uroporphyrinogen decarboxylase, chloroplastic-like [Capsicum annuum]|nr:putative uroporphyrinogen decarboxylase, chloroplastic-like [Capsicum annuum]KAF3646317.1 putative uroporphyrinogen decarboxylase, chloroplastic-like [Capsicum annuum]
MLQPLSLWLQDGNEGRGGREEKVIHYWLALISGLATKRVYGTMKLCDYAILSDGDHQREGDGHPSQMSQKGRWWVPFLILMKQLKKRNVEKNIRIIKLSQPANDHSRALIVDKTLRRRKDDTKMVSYKRTTSWLKLPSDLASVHPVFHVSLLTKCIGDPEVVVPIEGIDVQNNLAYKEIPFEILNY